MPEHNVAKIPNQMIFTKDQVEVGEIIGAGSKTRVHRGKLKSRNMTVAIKHLWGDKAVEYCKREVAAMQRLDHPNVVKTFGFCEVSKKEAYLILELSEDGALSTSALALLPPFHRLIQALKWCLQMAEGVKYIHCEKVLHLDIKLANTLRFGDVAKLCDFGTAKEFDEEKGWTTGTDRHSCAYAASEVLLGLGVFPETDLYSLGCVLSELVTGKLPWGTGDITIIHPYVMAGKSPLDVVQHAWPPICPEEVRLLAAKLLSYDASVRGTVDEIIETLQCALEKLLAPKVDAAHLFAAVCPYATGWLNSIDELPTFSDSIQCLAKIRAPPNRPDLTRYEQSLTRPQLINWYQHIHSMALTSEDAEVIALYTAESPICYMLNGMLSQIQCPEGDRDCIAPLTKRLLNAVWRLGQPYQGRGFRALYADAPPLLAAFNDYATHFAVGASVNIFQFLSFTTNPEHIQHFIKHNRSVILLKCDDLIGYDIDALSYQTLCGGPREQEVLVLPPAYFTVKSHPYKVNNIVHVDLVYHAKISQDGSYVAQCAPDSRDTQNTSSLNSSLSVDFLGASNAALSARDPTEGDVNTDTLHPDPVEIGADTMPHDVHNLVSSAAVAPRMVNAVELLSKLGCIIDADHDMATLLRACEALPYHHVDGRIFFSDHIGDATNPCHRLVTRLAGSLHNKILRIVMIASHAPIADSFVMIHSLETTRYAVNAPDNPMDAATVAGLNRLKQFFIPVVAAPDGPPVPSARLLFAWHGTSPDNVAVACRDDHRSLRASDYQFFGAGSYFALEAAHAVRFSEQVRGESAMILCAVSVSQARVITPEGDYRRNEDPSTPYLHGFSRYYSVDPVTAVALAPGCDAHFIPVKDYKRTHPLTGDLTPRNIFYQAVDLMRDEAEAHELVIGSHHRCIPLAVVYCKRF